ncbi:MAG: CoA-binding protein [Chloroflexi bacterium]|nr:CoA-binding protein [Chloroflexota bacterium]
MDDSRLRDLLENARVIAVVGHSDDPARDSYRIGRYLRDAGYVVYPVNPTLTEIDGERCYPDLASVPEPIDIVDVFRRAEFLPDIVRDAVRVDAGAVWGQFTVTHPEADRIAAETGIPLVMDRCILVEHRRLGIPKRT